MSVIQPGSSMRYALKAGLYHNVLHACFEATLCDIKMAPFVLEQEEHLHADRFNLQFCVTVCQNQGLATQSHLKLKIISRPT